MKIPVYQKLELGELVAAAYDEAARYSTDSRVVSRLATHAITHLLQGARKGARAWPASKRVEKNVAEVTAAAFRLLHSASCTPPSCTRRACTPRACTPQPTIDQTPMRQCAQRGENQ